MTYLGVWPNSLEGFVKMFKLIICVETAMWSIPEKTEMFNVSGHSDLGALPRWSNTFQIMCCPEGSWRNPSAHHLWSGGPESGRLFLNILSVAGCMYVSFSVVTWSPTTCTRLHGPTEGKSCPATTTECFYYIVQHAKYKHLFFKRDCNRCQIHIVSTSSHSCSLFSLLLLFVYSHIY